MNVLKRTGAEHICLALKRASADLVFGIPGVHNLTLFEALRRAGIRVIVPGHEQGAAFMAIGYSRMTGKPGVIVTVPGPGLTNALTGIGEAYLDSVPLVALVTNVRLDQPQRFQIHQVDQVALASPLSKAVLTVRQPGDVMAQLSQAFTLAADEGQPGPVVVDIAADVFTATAETNNTATQTHPAAALTDDTAGVEESIKRIADSRQVGLFLGQGASGAGDAALELAEWLAAPVATTHSGRGIIREDHPLVMAFAWHEGGIEAVNKVFSQCDLILAIGMKFSEHGTGGFSLKLPMSVIHVDRCDDVFGHNYRCDQYVRMDAGRYLRALLARKATFGPRSTHRDTIVTMLAALQKELAAADIETTRCIIGAQSWPVTDFFTALRIAMPDDTVLVTDSGHHQILTSRYFPVYKPHTMLVPANYQAMGFGIPVAVGAAIANPAHPVVAIIGDGSFLMTGFELLAAVREQVRLAVLLFNNNAYGILKDIQEEEFGSATSTTLLNPNYEGLAASFGLPYYRANGPLADVLTDLLRQPGPVLLEVAIESSRRNTTHKLRRRLKADLRQVVSQFTGFRQSG